MAQPVRLASFADFERVFGNDPAAGALADYVRLFFLNGGTDCYVMRVAHEPGTSIVELQTEAGASALTLRAKSPGSLGEYLRAEVSYPGGASEKRFNMRVFRWRRTAGGREEQSDVEEFRNLSMAPSDPAYAPDVISQRSALVDATVAPAPTAGNGLSFGRRPIPAATAFGLGFKRVVGTGDKRFGLSLGGRPPITVTFDADAIADSAGQTGVAAAIGDAITDALSDAGLASLAVAVSWVAGPSDGGTGTRLLALSHAGDLALSRARNNDVAETLGLGSTDGGIEIGPFSAPRPACTGVVTRGNVLVGGAPDLFNDLGSRAWNSLQLVRIQTADAAGAVTTVEVPLELGDSGRVWLGEGGAGHDGVRQLLRHIASRINAHAISKPRTFFWRASASDYRLHLVPTAGPSNFIAAVALVDSTGADISLTDIVLSNVRHYSVGASGGGAGRQRSPSAPATDGTPAEAEDYDEAYRVARREIDLFNLLVLPPRSANNELLPRLYGPASALCQQKRAFLIMDPPETWRDPQTASEGADASRIGVVNDHAAVYYPNVLVPGKRREIELGPAGAMAGLYARTDGTRGVWTTPAGTDAELRGVVGVGRRMEDTENGWLNQRGVNAIRVQPNGIVSWGARTLDGDDDFASEYKYIAVRRTALYIEESLTRGLKWVVFEPNEPSLWAQIRLVVGSFLNGMHRRGAFGAVKPSQAYYVRCDASTTPPADQRAGIVNIEVGFQPLYPAEFVVLTIRQMTGEAGS
ncbi:MAG: phage tail sheath family protein [Myxococcales bacterium]|nr:phage tail sheath family protein [Myxococcales bacterium]